MLLVIEKALFLNNILKQTGIMEVNEMKIAIGCDHGGFNLKNTVIKHLEEKGIEVKDFGTYSTDSCDYPDISIQVAEAVAKKNLNMVY